MSEKLSKEEEIIEKLNEIKEKVEIVSRIILTARTSNDLENMKYSSLKTIKEMLNQICNEADGNCKIFRVLL